MNYLDTLAQLHAVIKPSMYLEIGVQTGASLRLAKCPAIGVDPRPCVTGALPSQHIVFNKTSDQFFADPCGMRRVDFAFVDGLHHFDQVLADIANIIPYCHPGSVIALHDTMPRDAETSGRDPLPGHWTGDVWKAASFLAMACPSLHIWTIGVPPSGLSVLVNLPGREIPPIPEMLYDWTFDKYQPVNLTPLDEFWREFQVWQETVGSGIN